ncbi:MAG: hypothetical protein K2X69_01875 [Silvanigrellaceae bacterium]|nr:hypothetical protein [Silvanigrellaceae bacterium]
MQNIVKYHKLISFAIGLGFLIVVQKYATPQPVFRFLVPAFFVLALLATFYNNWYLKQINKFNFWLIVRPLMLLLAGFGLFLIIPSEAMRGLFLISAVLLITFSEILLGATTESLLINETLLIAFGLFFTFSALYQYAPLYGIYYVVALFILTALLTRSFYEFVAQSTKVKLVSAVVLALFTAEIFWCLSFLPLHFSALALVLFNIFYFCLILNYYNFFHVLSLKKIQFHLLLIFVCTVVVLFSTPWSIIQ